MRVGTLPRMAPDPPSGPEDGPGPLPDPLDRIWFHPSELQAFVEARIAPTATRTWPAPVAIVLVGLALIMTLAVVANGPPSPARSSFRAVLLGSPGGPRSLARLSVVTVRGRVGDDGAAALGSGLALDGNVVLTPAHTLAGASDLTVVTSSGTAGTATVVGTDLRTDLAVLRVTGPTLASATLGTAESLSPGAPVVAIADGGWSIAGKVSALHQAATGPLGVRLVGLVEVDFATPEGAAGGCVLDADGSVVAVLLGSGGRDRMAVPIEVARDVALQLLLTGRVVHPWLGLEVADGSTGAEIATVADPGPAAAAGVRRGDVVVAVAGVRVATAGDVLAEVQRHKPGEGIQLTLVRRDRTVQAAVVLGPAPTPTTRADSSSATDEDAHAMGPDLPNGRRAATMGA